MKMFVYSVSEKEATIGYHQGSAVKIRNTCCRSVTHRLVDLATLS